MSIEAKRIAALAAATIAIAPVSADAAPSASELASKILLRALSFDRNLKDRIGSDLTVGVLITTDGADREVLAAVRALSGTSIAGATIKIVELTPDNLKHLHAELKRLGVDVLMVPPGATDIAGVAGLCRALRMPTMTVGRGELEKGLALGVAVTDGRPRLLVNLSIAREVGMDLSSEVLSLAQVLR